MLRRVVVPVAGLATMLLFAAAAVAGEKGAPEDKFFESNGVKIHYVEKGEGEPVVLIHGFGANIGRNWVLPGIFEALAEDYHVIAIDNRGHGSSDKPHESNKYGVEMVEDVVRLLDHLKIEKAHIVGYSMGGFITNKLLSLHSDRFITATLGGAGWSRAGDEGHSLLEALAQSLEEGKGVGPLIIALTPPGKPQPTEQEIQFINQMMLLNNDAKALAAVARSMPNLQIQQELLEANKVPTLSLIGEVDPLKVGVDRLQEVMANLNVVVLEGADHMTALPHPLFVKTLKQFLKDHSATPVAETAGAGK